MTITLHIEAEGPAELQQAIKGLANTTTTTVITTPEYPAPEDPAPEDPAPEDPAPEDPAPKRTRKAKQETPEEQPTLDLKEEPAETTDEPKTETADEPDAPIPTVVELRALAAEKGRADAANKPKIRAILKSYECESISTVPEDKRAAVKADMEAL